MISRRRAVPKFNSLALREAELSPQQKVLQRVATNAVREACEVRHGRLTPRAILAYQWLAEPLEVTRAWSLAWVCSEIDWDAASWKKKSLAYVHKQWRKIAWRAFLRDLELRSRQVRALADGSPSDCLPLVEALYWREIADAEESRREGLEVDPNAERKLEFGDLPFTKETESQ